MKKLLAALIVLVCGLPSARAQQTHPMAQLKYVMIVTRHGVRSPTWSPDRLNGYSDAPWPEWGALPGDLTAHGRALMRLMGRFYREYFTAEGLLSRQGCPQAGRTYFWADVDQRTLETARTLADEIVPGCRPEVHSAPGQSDALFDPIEAGAVKPDAKLSLAAVEGRLGPRLDAVIDAHRAAFDVLDHLLHGGGKAANSIFDQPMSLLTGDAGVSMNGPLNLASTLSEDFLLEYADGKKGNELGWGRLNGANLRQIMSLHTAYADLMRRTRYLAQARGSNLMSHILRSLEQAVAGKPVAGAVATPEAALVVISGHDTNLSDLSGMLGLSWTLPGYQSDDTPPGGALIFSLWQSNVTSSYAVRVQFVAQTLDQMRDATPLTIADPPPIADIFVPGCSTSQEGFPCDWPDFRTAIQAAIRPEFVP